MPCSSTTLPFDIVCGTDRDTFARSAHQLGEHDIGKPIDFSCIAADYSIKPSASARPAGSDAILMPLRPQPFALRIIQLGGEWTFPTRVIYAFATPITLLIFVGPTPVPVQAPPAVG